MKNIANLTCLVRFCWGQCSSIDSGLKYFLFKNILKLFILFIKNIFNINTSKRYKNIKKIHFKQKKIQILKERNLHCIFKHFLNVCY